MIPASLYIVTSTYVADGRIVCDIVRMGVGGGSLTAVPTLTMGGGPNRGLVVPPTPAVQPNGSSPGAAFDVAINEGAQVVVIFVAIDPMTTPRPFIIGCTGHVGLGLVEGQSQSSDVGDDSTAELDARAVAVLNAGARVVLDQRGEVTVQPTPGGNTRVQLSEGAIMRVSRDGDATDNAVLAQALVDALEAAYTEINRLSAQVAILTDKAIADTATGSIPPPPFFASTVATPTTDQVASDVLRLSPDRPVA